MPLNFPSLRNAFRLAAVAGCLFLAQPALSADIAWVWYSSDAPAGFEEFAVLADTLLFAGERIETRHRLRSLWLPPRSSVTPVIHVHQDAALPPRLGARHAEAIAVAIDKAAQRSTSHWVQLDFEALDSQQAFYVALVKRLRARLPATIKLSLTMRAAWCDKPALLASLEADEVVPMFFRMGALASDYRERLIGRPESFDLRCRQVAVGFARQEALPQTVAARYQRRYWFNYRNWQ